MAWSKGAVVVVKRGDAAIADAIHQGINIQTVSKEDYAELERDFYFCKKSNKKLIDKAIEDAQIQYGRHFIPPKPIRIVMEGFAFIIYWYSRFIEWCGEVVLGGDVK